MVIPHSALQTENFESLPEDLICSICKSVFYDPVECPCSHVYCRTCIINWLDVRNTCPICRKRTTVFDLDSTTVVENMIMKLTVRCPNIEQGCEQNIALEAYDSHVETCDYGITQCMKCKENCLRKNMFKHEQEECEYRSVRCERHCSMMIPHKLIKSHSCIEELKKELKNKESLIDELRSEVVDYKKQLEKVKEKFETSYVTVFVNVLTSFFTEFINVVKSIFVGNVRDEHNEQIETLIDFSRSDSNHENIGISLEFNSDDFQLSDNEHLNSLSLNSIFIIDSFEHYDVDSPEISNNSRTGILRRTMLNADSNHTTFNEENLIEYFDSSGNNNNNYYYSVIDDNEYLNSSIPDFPDIRWFELRNTDSTETSSKTSAKYRDLRVKRNLDRCHKFDTVHTEQEENYLRHLKHKPSMPFSSNVSNNDENHQRQMRSNISKPSDSTIKREDELSVTRKLSYSDELLQCPHQSKVILTLKNANKKNKSNKTRQNMKTVGGCSVEIPVYSKEPTSSVYHRSARPLQEMETATLQSSYRNKNAFRRRNINNIKNNYHKQKPSFYLTKPKKIKRTSKLSENYSISNEDENEISYIPECTNLAGLTNARIVQKALRLSENYNSSFQEENEEINHLKTVNYTSFNSFGNNWRRLEISKPGDSSVINLDTSTYYSPWLCCCYCRQPNNDNSDWESIQSDKQQD